ncbi:MAG: HAD-IIA family hydrolase [Candidatus Acetothermia bacterium]
METSDFNLRDYSVYFVDMDGVIVRSDHPIEGASESIEKLRGLGDVYVLSNNSTRSRESFADRLHGAGVDLPPEYIINSSFIASKYIVEKHGAVGVYPVGEEGLSEELMIAGNEVLEANKADVVVAGMDRGISYVKLAGALEALNSGARFYATNTDKTFPTPEGEKPGAGATVGAIEGMGFPPEKVTGKPSSIAAEIAMEVAGVTEPSDCLVIGDRLETDILMAERAGMNSVLALSGVDNSYPEGSETEAVKPTLTVHSLAELVLG